MPRSPKVKSEPVYEVRDDPEKRVFPHPPGSDIKEEFRDWVRTTGKPHEWRYHLSVPPPADAKPEILLEFDIPERFRERLLMAPCPMCQPRHPKYWSGMLAYFPNEQAVRAIGAECGHSFLADGVFAQALQRYRRNSEREAELEFLIRNLPKVSAANRALRSLIPQADAADRVRDCIRHVISRRCALELRASAGGRNALHHFDMKKVPVIGRYGEFQLDKDGAVVMRDEAFVVATFPFFGSEALLDVRKSAKADAITAEVLLNGLETSNEDEVLALLSVRGDDGLAEPVLRIRKAWTMLESLRLQLIQLKMFLEPQNIESLGAWGRDRKASRHVRAYYDKYGRLEIGEIGKKSRSVPILGILRADVASVPALED